IVSFHFGLPEDVLLDRVKATGAKILSSATTVAEARWLEAKGCDAIIAQGFEAGGHRGLFLSDDLATQVGTMALVPHVGRAVAGPGLRGRRLFRRAGGGSSAGARRPGRAGRPRLSAHARGEGVRAAQTGSARQQPQRGYGVDKPVHRAPGAWHRQPGDARG